MEEPEEEVGVLKEGSSGGSQALLEKIVLVLLTVEAAVSSEAAASSRSGSKLCGAVGRATPDRGQTV